MRAEKPAVSTEFARPGRGYSRSEDAHLTRLRRRAGQARRLQPMVRNQQYRIDILFPISTTTRTRPAVAAGLLEDHLGHCVRDAPPVTARASGAPRPLPPRPGCAHPFVRRPAAASLPGQTHPP